MISVFATLCSTSGGAGPLGGRTAPVTQGCSAGRLWLWPQTVTCCPSLSSGAGAQWSGSWEPVAQLQSGRGGPGSGRRRGLAVPRGLSGTLATPTWPPPGAWAPQCSMGTGFQRRPGRGEPQGFCDPASEAPGCPCRWRDWPSKSGDRSRLQKRVNVPSVLFGFVSPISETIG